MKYKLTGKRQKRRTNYNEPFEAIVEAQGYDDAQHIARAEMADEWHNIRIEKVVQIAKRQTNVHGAAQPESRSGKRQSARTCRP